jgi:Lipocalin-like domain
VVQEVREVREVRGALKVLVLVVLAVLVLEVPARTQVPAARDLVGTWTLSAVARLGDDGAAANLPLPHGLLVYDAAGHAFELVTSGRRKPYAANQPTAAEARALYDTYSGFWGAYAADAARKTITYRPEGAISPNAMGANVVRTFDLHGDRLVVTATAGEPDGQSGLRWTWERVPRLENLTTANRRLIGFWQHVVEQRVNASTGAVLNETHRSPSIIVYTPSGYVGVHFPPLNRPRFAATMPTDEEALGAIRGLVSYYGAYTMYPGLVFHHRLIILGSTSGDSLRRSWEIAGGELHLRFPPVMFQGQEVRTMVTLKRLSGEKEMMR